MASSEKFKQLVTSAYTFQGKSILVGSAILDNDYATGCTVNIPLRTLNRHGLISGATGTGKTKTLQLLAEGLSDNGVPVLFMDIKGDLSGMACSGATNPIIEQRASQIGISWNPSSYPVELMSISNEPGVRLRATASEFGPMLLGNILGLNETQQSVLSLVFQFCDDKNLPLVDLKDLHAVFMYIQNEGKVEFDKAYGLVQSNSAGLIMRKILEISQQGGDKFFGEPSFEIMDLVRKDKDQHGFINILRLTDLQTRPQLFSAFMLCLLAEVFQKFPERGDAEKPELVIFIDEAHLIFSNASKELLDQIEMTIKLIRSKGVGIFFVTQLPTDVPESILSQLGLKIQHALRAFTAKDRKSIKLVAENYPSTEFYKVEDALTQLGIGEAFVTALNEKGIPTELVHTLLAPPKSRMNVLTSDEIKNILANSELVAEYNVDIDKESAYELLNQKLVTTQAKPIEKVELPKTRESKPTQSKKDNTFEEILGSPVTKTIVREVARGLFGVLGLKTGRSSSRKNYW